MIVYMSTNLEYLKDAKIKNIMIFVSDSLRWDFTPDSIKKMGVSFKSVASSLYTAASFPSIFSGLYPIKHQVFTWQDILRQQHRGLLNIPDMNKSLRCENTWVDMGPEDSQIHRLCGSPKGDSLDLIKEPFVYIEDDKGGHCPYGLSFDKYKGGGCFEFFKEYGAKERSELVQMYKKGISQSRDNFLKRINTLEKRNLLENTLIIFTSDHGELLGEYGGLVNHGRPPCPELVYVPTIFIHPRLKPKNITHFIVRHVDIYPTVRHVLGLPNIKGLDGVDLLTQTPKYGFSFQRGGHKKKTSMIDNYMRYSAKSVWDSEGGHVYHDLGDIRAKLFFYNRIILKKHPEFSYMRERAKDKKVSEKIRRYKEGVKALSKDHIVYGKPTFDELSGKQMISEYQKTVGQIEEQETLKMDKEVEERLKSLGYMD